MGNVSQQFLARPIVSLDSNGRLTVLMNQFVQALQTLECSGSERFARTPFRSDDWRPFCGVHQPEPVLQCNGLLIRLADRTDLCLFFLAQILSSLDKSNRFLLALLAFPIRFGKVT